MSTFGVGRERRAAIGPGWLVAIAVAAPALARAQAPADSVPLVAVAAHALPRGVTLADSDIVRRPATAMPLARARDTVSVAAGWVTRRVIRAGEPLREPAVAPPYLVHAGAPVSAEWRQGPIVLTLTGTVARTATLGERVLVRLGEKRELSGIVVGPSRVVISDSSRSAVASP